MNIKEILSVVKSIQSELDKLIEGRWYVGGSAGLLLLGYDLDRNVNDVDIIICAPNPCDSLTPNFIDPHHVGTELHKALVGPDWEYTKSSSHCVRDKRIISGLRNGFRVEFIIKIQEYPDPILEDIIKSKLELIKMNKDLDKHISDIEKLKNKYNLKIFY